MTTKNFILKTLEANRSQFSSIGVRDVGLFGSYVRDEQTENSDIDILIDFDPEKETYDNFLAVYDLLEKLFSQNKVDVVTKNGLSPYIGPKILNEVQYV